MNELVQVWPLLTEYSNDRAGLDAGEGQRAGVGDVVGPGAAAVGRQRDAGRRPAPPRRA